MHAAVTAAILVPKTGIRINPAQKDPIIAPNVLKEYALPTPLPTSSIDVVTFLLTTGKVAPIKVVGIIMTIAHSKN